MPSSSFAFAKPPAEKVKQLQRALLAAGAKDSRSRPPAVDGTLGPRTVEAVNYWNVLAKGTTAPAITREMIAANLDDLTAAIVRSNVPAAIKRPPAPAAATAAAPHTAADRTMPLVIRGQFDCRSGVCTPASREAADKARALQKALNQLPPTIRGAMIPVTGNIGSVTAAAYQRAMESAYRRQSLTPPVPLSQRNEVWIAQNLDMALVDVIAEVGAAFVPPQVPVPTVQPGATGAEPPAFQILPTGAATGNRPWKCMALSLQVQLNRLNQRLRPDGTIGINTQASVNKVLGQKWSIREIARELPAVVALVQKTADAKGAPPAPSDTAALAAAKCSLETSSPAADARIFGPAAVAAPTPPPTPAPTAPTDQPLPVPPSDKVKSLQGVLNQFPPQIIALYPNGRPLSVTGILNENDVGAVRAVVRTNYAQQGLSSGETDAAVANVTLSAINSGLDTVLAAVQRALTLAQQVYGAVMAAPASSAQPILAPPVAAAPSAPANVGQSKGGLLYQTTPAGIVGYGSNAAAFTSLVIALQVALMRIGQSPQPETLSGWYLGAPTKGKKRARPGRTSAGVDPSTSGGVLLQTGVIDPPTVAAFNERVVPKLDTPQVVTAVVLAADIENAVKLAQSVAAKAPDAPQITTAVPAAMQPDAAPLPPASAEQIAAQAVARGLPFEEAQAIVTAAKSPEEAQSMVDNAIKSAPVPDVITEDVVVKPAKGDSGNTKAAIGVGIGAAFTLGVVLIAKGVKGHRAERRARA